MPEDNKFASLKELALIAVIIVSLGVGFWGGVEWTKSNFVNKVKESIILGCFLFDLKNPDGTFSDKKTVYRITMDDVVIQNSQPEQSTTLEKK